MPEMFSLHTPRLLLRPWREEDLAPFAELNADPEVMTYFPNTLSKPESDALAERIQQLITDQGWGFWAAQLLSSGEFIGFVGLNQPAYTLPIQDSVEVGWRLARRFWGNGYATEAGLASLQFGFSELKRDNIISFTATTNHRSIAVMERLAMRNTDVTFLHPAVPDGHPLQRHVLYQLDQADWAPQDHLNQLR